MSKKDFAVIQLFGAGFVLIFGALALFVETNLVSVSLLELGWLSSWSASSDGWLCERCKRRRHLSMIVSVNVGGAADVRTRTRSGEVTRRQTCNNNRQVRLGCTPNRHQAPSKTPVRSGRFLYFLTLIGMALKVALPLARGDAMAGQRVGWSE